VIALDALNTSSPADFTAALGAIFEHSPWVAERAAAARPFESRLQLLDAMRTVVDAATHEEQLALIRAHPELGARGGSRAVLTEASAGEQRRAGLEACTTQQWARLHELNAAYVAKFSMPFILAGRGHDPESIIATCARRLDNDLSVEHRTALREIGLIAGYRLEAAVAAPAGAEVCALEEFLKGEAINRAHHGTSNQLR
jgi:OHCU decarboxylase